ncbi:disease resistance protein [Pyrus ussuriensis x Pyrus communis]|uniref:Disease resistance protein n=1 Tax=Pyrus ussuriensis x Pyrus communis TaxID=2448454 RepID=A0A5N5HNV7_9ROSA|nr:disease resistance protein [Pyrus ussuriensis x Pyrus communis]
MSGWNLSSREVRLGSGSISSSPFERTSTTRTIQLISVKPQTLGNCTIFCNDHKANIPIRFSVGDSIFYLLSL